MLYNAIDQVVEITLPVLAGQQTGYKTKYDYTKTGKLWKAKQDFTDGDSNPQTQMVQYSYNLLDNLKTIKDSLDRTTTNYYDDNENVISVVDPKGAAANPVYGTSVSYDFRDLKQTVTDAEGNQTHYSYNANGQLKTITDANDQTTVYDYDAYGRMIQTTYPDDSTEQYTYDVTGAVIAKKSRKDDTFSYSYDALGRLISKVGPGNDPNIAYFYDIAGRVLQIDKNGDKIDYFYDSLGRVEKITDPESRDVQYQYDTLGRRTRLTYPDDSFITYHYDAMSRLTDIKDPNSMVIAHYDFDELSRREALYYNYDGDANYLETGVDGVIRYDFEDKVTNPQTNNNLGSRLEAIGHDIDNNSVNDLSYAYLYDQVGNVLTKTIDDVNELNYGYDNIYQLLTGDYPAGWVYADETFSYDDLGSRDQTMGYTANRLNQYTSVNSVSYGYDDNGNLTDDGSYTYQYDAENRLLAIYEDSTLVVSYGYDVLGRRVSKTAGATTVNYCYDGDHVVAEYDGSGTLLRKFIYGPGIDEPICMIVPESPAVAYFYHQDALGSVVALSKFNSTLGSAEVVEKYSYSAFGETTVTLNGSTGNLYRFTGREYEPETGLYYYRARFYNPTIGRFLQNDPIGYIDSMNLYQYCGNNPIGFIDPFGKTTLKAISWAECTDVAIAVGLIDAGTVYVDSKVAAVQAKTMTDSIIADSGKSATSKERDDIQNAVLHGMVSAYFYRHLSEENAKEALDVHEIYNHGQMIDSIADQKNNAIAKTIGLGSGNIYAEVKDSYYQGKFYGSAETTGEVYIVSPLPKYVHDLANELDSINKELGRLLDSFNNYSENKKNCP